MSASAARAAASVARRQRTSRSSADLVKEDDLAVADLEEDGSALAAATVAGRGSSGDEREPRRHVAALRSQLDDRAAPPEVGVQRNRLFACAQDLDVVARYELRILCEERARSLVVAAVLTPCSKRERRALTPPNRRTPPRRAQRQSRQWPGRFSVHAST